MADITQMAIVTQITTYLRRLVTQPIGELNRAQRTLRFTVDLSRHCARQLGRDHATQMAAALTYRTIFSLVPIAVLMLLVFRSFGGFEQVSLDLQDRIYSYLGLSSIALPADGLNATPTPDASKEELRASIQKIMTDLTQQASEISVGSIGAVGLAVLIWAALALLVTVERSFNQIYNCPTGRSWHLRIPIYWAVITLGPVLLFVSLYVAEALVERVNEWVSIGGLSTVLSSVMAWLSRSTALLASWLLLFLLYVLMPTTRVRIRPALIGSLTAAILWELGKVGFKYYVSRAVSYSVLYGSLGLIPLFLFWLYLTWLIVLFGMEVTYTLQAMRGREFEKRAARLNQRQVYDPRWLLPLMADIGQAFRDGKSVGTGALAQQLRLPVLAIAQLCEKLQRNGLIHRVSSGGDENEGFTLAKPPEDITVSQLLELGRSISASGNDQPDQPGWSYVKQLDEAQSAAAGATTLAQVVEMKSSPQ